MAMEPVRPTEAELEILQILWQRQPCPVKTVYEALGETREVGYTTILKQMQRMLDKGLLRRMPGEGKSHVYVATVAREEVQDTLFDRLVDNVFGASVSDVVLHALGKGKASEEELAAIREFMDNLDKK